MTQNEIIEKAEQDEPFEYLNAVEGWVKIDEVRRHFDSVGCGTIYKRPGEGRVPLYLIHPQPKAEQDKPAIDKTPSQPAIDTTPQPKQEEQEPVALVTGVYGGRFVVEPTNTAMVLPVNIALYTRPQRQRVVFPTMLRKMWSGGEVQAWLDEHVNKE